MISRLSGHLVECDLTAVVIDVNGVGYSVSIPMSTYEALPQLGGSVVLHTHLSVRDDALQLFGFATTTERRLFRLLITVTGVGPRLALNVLSCMSVHSFCRTIVNADIKALAKVNGIGKRSAERLVVELREKVNEIDPAAAFDLPDDRAQQGALSTEARDAVAALGTLGFRPEAARTAVETVCRETPDKAQSAESLIRNALRRLNS